MTRSMELWYGTRSVSVPTSASNHGRSIFDTLRPDSYLLAFFHADEKVKEIPLYNYRIADQKHLLLQASGWAHCGQFFNNRALEKLFHRYKSVKFFLGRDNLREIIVRR